MTVYITEIPSDVAPNVPLIYRFTIPALDVIYHGQDNNGAGPLGKTDRLRPFAADHSARSGTASFRSDFSLLRSSGVL